MTHTPSIDRVRKAMNAYQIKAFPESLLRRNPHPAGVLVPLVWKPELVAILNLRPETMRRHAGEVCFPGGRPEAGDHDLSATALREAREELGITEATVLGQLSAMPLYNSAYRLVPFVAHVPEQTLDLSSGEVERVFEVGLAELYDRDHIDAIPYEWQGKEGLSPIFTLADGVIMYGGTAHTFLELLTVLAPTFHAQVPPLKAGAIGWGDLGFR